MNAETLYNLGLTMYSGEDSLKSSIYKSLFTSKLDESICLHPEQVKIIKQLKKENAMIISAPTSFGKTFCVFEYIYIMKPHIVVMVVPTLSLVDEYMKRILRKYKKEFSNYKTYINIDKNRNYDLTYDSLFILTHDKTVNEDVLRLFNRIDFLVIDEVYKLENNSNDERVIVLNCAYYELAKRSQKYVLLAPFIEDVLNRDKLINYPLFYKSDYSPVFNKLIQRDILVDDKNERYNECDRILNELDAHSKTLIYFPKVVDLNQYVETHLCKLDEIEIYDSLAKKFINWASKEIHSEWSVVKAMKRGFLIHNGQITRGTKSICLYLFENDNEFNRLLCTSSLLEGVNTVTENIIITKPYNSDNEFSAFDFYNLIGRSGRLNKYYVGNAYYIKSPENTIYKKEMAARKIEFELTTGNDDMEIALGNTDSNAFTRFILKLGISSEDYKTNIGFRTRFSSVVELYDSLEANFEKLIEELKILEEKSASNDKTNMRGTIYLISILCNIFKGEIDFSNQPLIINYLLNLNRPSVKSIIDSILRKSEPDKKIKLDTLINSIIKCKYSYIEHEFYNKVCIIYYFLKLKKINPTYLDIYRNRIISRIETLYYLNNNQQRMLYEIGIYDKDIRHIIDTIGNDFDNMDDLLVLLETKWDDYRRKVSFISQFLIENILKHS